MLYPNLWVIPAPEYSSNILPGAQETQEVQERGTRDCEGRDSQGSHRGKVGKNMNKSV